MLHSYRMHSLIGNIQYHSVKIIQPHYRCTTFCLHSQSAFTKHLPAYRNGMHSEVDAFTTHSKSNGIHNAFSCVAFSIHSTIIQCMHHSWIAAFTWDALRVWCILYTLQCMHIMSHSLHSVTFAFTLHSSAFVRERPLIFRMHSLQNARRMNLCECYRMQIECAREETTRIPGRNNTCPMARCVGLGRTRGPL